MFAFFLVVGADISLLFWVVVVVVVVGKMGRTVGKWRFFRYSEMGPGGAERGRRKAEGGGRRGRRGGYLFIVYIYQPILTSPLKLLLLLSSSTPLPTSPIYRYQHKACAVWLDREKAFYLFFLLYLFFVDL
ncbi:hypothetical protein DFP73DRAFT_535606 [Morchella snyderi]|nr:hypothetical protein DFP73DRAFT_535606 [Morchella snyderi]